MRHAFGFACLAILASSCVHEFPAPADGVEVVLTVRHEMPWTTLDYDYGTSGSRNDGDWKARYVFRAYHAGSTASPVHEFTFYSDDISLGEFTARMSLPPGDWEIYAWQDFVSDSRDFYDTADFSSITYRRPYTGDSDMRDAFEGSVPLAVPATYQAASSIKGELTMTRPFAKYVFIATDYDKFLAEMNRRAAVPDGYSTVGLYPMFMPAVYDMFTQKVTDSWRGTSYDASITPLGNGEAAIAMDYVMINHRESAAQVQIGLRGPGSQLTALTGTVNVPLLRGQVTYVRGDFLTASVGGGIDIDFSFSGDNNIEI